jgi:carbon storage regulator
MLILSRKPNESLVIQDNIIITVLAIEGDRVKLGITAPREVPVLRQELWVAIHEQNQVSDSSEPVNFNGLPHFLAVSPTVLRK